MDITRDASAPRGPRNRIRSAVAPVEAPAAPMTLVAPFQQFFATSPVPCPYVGGRAERKLIVELAGHEAPGFYDGLSRAGFRRSHRFAYRPACRGCTSCVPVRIVAADFAPTRSLRRILAANRDVAARLVPARATPEQFQLFAQYQRSRHADSDMAGMSFGDYRSMIEDTPVRTEVLEFRDAGRRLVAASLVDRLDDGFSAVYSFYDPGQALRGLGNLSVLRLVEECRSQGLAYVYLGYWIGESRKMAYKARFPALERLGDKGWTAFRRAAAPPS